MIETPLIEYCSVCSKCLNDEPVLICCEICNNKICNDCRAIDKTKRTIIATSLTKTGSKPASGRLLSILGSKLSVLSAFRSGLSKSSFEFDETEEEDLDRDRRSKNDESDLEFDKYFDKQYSESKHHSSDKHKSDRHHLDTKHRFKHNKIEKQLSFQYTSERRRLSYRTNEGGSLDMDNSKVASSLLSVPIDQQQSRSDSQLDRSNSIKKSTHSRTNSFERMDQMDSNNNNLVRTRLKIPQLNRMVSLDERTPGQLTRSPMERSNTVDHCENTLERRTRLENIKQTNDFILSICLICAKQISGNYRSSTGGEFLKKITRSASEKLRRSSSITRTLIHRSNLIKTQSNLTNQAVAPTIDIQPHKSSIQQHRHSTDDGTVKLATESIIRGSDDQINDPNNLQFFKQSQLSSSQLTATNIVPSATRSTHAQLKSVNSSPLPSTAQHRIHQPVYNQNSQPLGSTITYKSPPPNGTPVPNSIPNHHLISQAAYIDNSEFNSNNYYMNQNIGSSLVDSAAFPDQYDPNLSLNQMTPQQPLPMQQMNIIANHQPYITPKYVRSNFSNKKLPTIDCSKISSMNPLLNPQTNNQYASNTPFQSQHPQSVKNPLSAFIHQKSPPSSGSSLEANSPRSVTSQKNVVTTLNSSSSSSSPHPAHQAQSNFSTSVKTTNVIGNIGNSGAQQTTNILNNPLGAMGKVLSDLVSSDTRSAAIQELRETVYRKVSTRFRSSSTSSSSTSSSCSLSNYPSIDSHINNNQHIYHAPSNLIQNAQNSAQISQHPVQAMYLSSFEQQTPIQQQSATENTQRTGRQLPHIPGQQTYYQFHNQLSHQSQHQIMMTENQSLENSPSPKTPLNLSRGSQSKFANVLNSSNATAFRFPPTNPQTINSVATINTGTSIQQPIQPPHSPLKNQSSDEYPCSSTTISSHRSRSSSSDIYEEQPTSPIPAHNIIHPSNLNRHNTLQATNLRADSTLRNRPLRKQRAIHMIDNEQQPHFNQLNSNLSASIYNNENIPLVQEDHLLIQQGSSASSSCSPHHSIYSLPASSVKTQRSNLGFSQSKLQQAKSFTMLQQSTHQSRYNRPQLDDEQIRWNWRENRANASSSGLFRCKSACETNTTSALNQTEEATVEPRTGCVFRKMTIKRRDPSYHALDINSEQSNQPRKLSFNSELITNESQSSQHGPNLHSPMSSAQQIANFFKEPVHKSHSEDSKANRYKKDTILHNGSSGSDPLIHRKLGSFLPHISVSDYSANSRRPSAVDGDPEMNESAMLTSSRFNSNNFLSSEASNTSTSRTSLHDALSSSSSNTPSNMILGGFEHISPSTSTQHHLKQPVVPQRRNSSENKLNPNTLIYRQSRSLSNSAHSQEIEDQLIEKLFYSQPTLLSKNASVDHMYPVLNNSKQKQTSLFPSNQNTFGEVLVSIYYNNLIQTLEIKVREARNLVPVDNKLSNLVLNQIIKSPSSSNTTAESVNLSNKPINPYVKTYLMPDRSSNSKRKTRVKTDTKNPVFNDLLSYIVDSKDVHNRTLWLGVWHRDRFGLSVLLGELILSLDNINLNDSEYKWYPLKRNNQANNFLSDLHLKKSWPQLDTLKNDLN